MFEPIAIIGRACLLPGALTPEQLWENRLRNIDSLDRATSSLWGMNPNDIVNGTSAVDHTWTDRCGYVKGFEDIFDPQGFAIPKDKILRWDVLDQWLLHAGREALKNAGFSLADIKTLKAGSIIGNLCYPTQKLTQFAESVWLNRQSSVNTHPDNRFMSGLPIMRMAEGLGLTADAFAIDAACASSLYAIKLACDRLHDGTADVMLAGGVNAVDSLFLQMGFTALQALSKTGNSRPFHAQADGLIPTQGVALLTLRRLSDAIAQDNPIYGIIRGVGLSNDGTGSGLLVPTEAGQIAAMQEAYSLSGLTPDDISWVECHATGTPLGDATEIRSMEQVFKPHSNIDIGALKANIGHSITASGAAALINVLSAFEAGVKPPARYTNETFLASSDSHFCLLEQSKPWDNTIKPRRAAINCFGFGGNNAHLLVEEWQPQKQYHTTQNHQRTNSTPIAVIGLGVTAGNVQNKTEFMEVLAGKRNALSEYASEKWGGYIDSISLPIQGTPFPPADLKCALGQQLALLKASQEALSEMNMTNTTRTSVLVGMQCDAEIARCGLRWRLPALFPEVKDAAWINETRDQVHPPVQGAHILGYMPNIVVNRVNHIFNFQAPSYSVLAEEQSSMTALKIALRDLQHQSIDMAVVGAVDIGCETVHQTAIAASLNAKNLMPGDAAIVLVLKRLPDAQRDNHTIYGIISPELDKDRDHVTDKFGYVYTASGLLQLAADILSRHTTHPTIKIKETEYA